MITDQLHSPLAISPADLRWTDKPEILAEGGVEVRREMAPSTGYLFFGPYISLPGGLYFISFDGELSGSLEIDLSHNLGRTIKVASIESFDEVICVSVPNDCRNFEVRATSTAQLERFVLRNITIEPVSIR